MKKKTPKIEAPAIITNESDAWQRATKATAEKFNSVQIVRSNPHINIDMFRRNYDDINWHNKKQYKKVITQVVNEMIGVHGTEITEST
jgi:hypothetical protein